MAGLLGHDPLLAVDGDRPRFAHQNENLLIFNPLWLALVVLVPVFLVIGPCGAARRERSRSAILALAAIALLAHFVGLSSQNNLAIIALGLAAGARRLALVAAARRPDRGNVGCPAARSFALTAASSVVRSAFQRAFSGVEPSRWRSSAVAIACAVSSASASSSRDSARELAGVRRRDARLSGGTASAATAAGPAARRPAAAAGLPGERAKLGVVRR